MSHVSAHVDNVAAHVGNVEAQNNRTNAQGNTAPVVNDQHAIRNQGKSTANVRKMYLGKKIPGGKRFAHKGKYIAYRRAPLHPSSCIVLQLPDDIVRQIVFVVANFKSLWALGLVNKEWSCIVKRRLDMLSTLLEPPFCASRCFLKMSWLRFATGCVFDAHAMIKLCKALEAVPMLETIDLSNYKISIKNNVHNVYVIRVFFDALGNGVLPYLQKLSLRYTHFGTKGVCLFCNSLEALPKLHTLEVNDNEFGDEGTIEFSKALANGALPALRKLDLTKNNISDDGIRSLCAAIDKRPLEIFCLDHNLIGDNGMRSITDAVRNGALPLLQWFTMRDNKIGNAGISSFCDVLKEEMLPFLTVYDFDKKRINGDLLETFSAQMEIRQRAKVTMQRYKLKKWGNRLT